ncbi:MAG: DUF2927 domain-containing protein [Cyanobacteria bacterium P01_A01_bin.135]
MLLGTILAVLELDALELPPRPPTAEQPKPLPPPAQPEPLPELQQTPATPSPQRGTLLTDVNVRYRPTVRSPVQTVGRQGDQVEISNQTKGLDDAYQWYLVRLPSSVVEGWVRGDLISGVPAQPPLDEPMAQQAPQERGVGGSGAAANYSLEALQYFQEIAFGNEFGSSSRRQIRKWVNDPIIRVHGSPTAADRVALAQIVAELNTIIGRHSPQVQLVILDDGDRQEANLDIYFVPHLEFPSYEPNYQPGNLGFAYVNWSQNRIYRGRILISTVDITQQERSHLIREELTQAMGLLQDSEWYDKSIFYQGWTSTTEYTELDETVIEMLYYPAVQPGMDERSAIAALGLPPRIQPAEGPANFLLPMGRRLFNQLKPW